MPAAVQVSLRLWTQSLIGKRIERQFGRSLSLASVSRIMKLLGFSAEKPLYQAWQQDPVLDQKWELEAYPKLRAEARREGLSIDFADEADIHSDCHTGTTSAPVRETTGVKASSQLFSLNMISAVRPRGEFHFMVHDGTFTAAVFKRLLQRLLIGAKRPNFLIVDGHATHKAKLVDTFVESTDGQLKLYFPPACSPHLNPDETVWGHVKREVAKGGVENKDHLRRLALRALRRTLQQVSS